MKGANIKGLDSIIRKMEKLPNSVKVKADAVLQAAAETMTNNAVADAPVHEGRLKGVISFDRLKQMDYSVSAGVFYAPFIEFGTKSKAVIPAELTNIAAQFRGGKQSEGDAKKAIYEWCRLQNIAEDKWYLIYRSIMINGIKPQPFFFHNFYAAEAQARQDLKQVIKDALND